MRTWAIILVVFFCGVECFAQDNNEVLSHIPDTGKSLTDFIPKGYDTLALAIGYLNHDGKMDVAMVLYDLREDTVQEQGDGTNEFNDVDRLLIIIFKTEQGWKLETKSGNLIMCNHCGGMEGINGYPTDPFSSIEIKNELLIINQKGGFSAERWSSSLKFKYLKNGFYLTGKATGTYSKFECEKLHENPGEFEDINLVTGEMKKRRVSESCKIILDKKEKRKIQPLIKLSDYHN